jgi:hypothetical protein
MQMMRPNSESETSGLVKAVIAFAIVLSGLQFVFGLGIFQGRAWGFWGGAIFFGLSILGGSKGIASIGIAVYCVLRLMGQIGPKPT